MILTSLSWKITEPLRFVWDRIGNLGSYFKIRKLQQLIWAKMGYQKTHPEPKPETVKRAKEISKTYSTLEFKDHDEPLVSIIIPVYNQHLYTFHSLKSILLNTKDISYEVIVVNDCSTDQTRQMLSGITGIRVVHNEENLGFIQSSNKGAQEAKGKYIVMLNNDTEVQPKWLKALVETFECFPDAGLVGAKLISSDEKLQEAGGIVWQDGSAWNYGRGAHHEEPDYSYCREVDYCSGACIIVEKSNFIQLGMFDEFYLPAYYEDTDLAFKVRASGRKVYYQPFAKVIHFEGVSCGTDVQHGVKQYQKVNHRKFYQRWQKELQSHRAPGLSPHLEKERHINKRVLVIDSRALTPNRDSGSLRTYHLLKILQKQGCKVTFIPDNLFYDKKHIELLQFQGVECFYSPYIQSMEEYLKQSGSLYDLVIVSRVDNACKHMDHIRKFCPQAKVIFDTVDLHFLREQRQAELFNNQELRRQSDERKQQELEMIGKVDLTFLVSYEEVKTLQEYSNSPMRILSNIHKVYTTEYPYEKRTNILFIGSFEHPPNVDAMLFFIEKIWPIVQQKQPQVKLQIIGNKIPSGLLEKSSTYINFMGTVDDLKPIFNQARLSIAPLRYGAGVKGKINMSMAFGVPVVATQIAAEGMYLKHNENVLIADDPSDFAENIYRLYHNKELWSSLSNAGKENVDKYFSFAAAEKQLQKALEDLGIR